MIATQDIEPVIQGSPDADTNTIQDTAFLPWQMPEVGSDEARCLELSFAFPKESHLRFAGSL
jgi:hypothetical protein